MRANYLSIVCVCLRVVAFTVMIGRFDHLPDAQGVSVFPGSDLACLRSPYGAFKS